MSYLSIWTVPILTTVRQKIATSWLISVFLKEFMVTSSTAALQNGVSRKKIIILFVLFLISWSSLSFCSLFKNQIPTSFFYLEYDTKSIFWQNMIWNPKILRLKRFDKSGSKWLSVIHCRLYRFEASKMFWAHNH